MLIRESPQFIPVAYAEDRELEKQLETFVSFLGIYR